MRSLDKPPQKSRDMSRLGSDQHILNLLPCVLVALRAVQNLSNSLSPFLVLAASLRFSGITSCLPFCYRFDSMHGSWAVSALFYFPEKYPLPDPLSASLVFELGLRLSPMHGECRGFPEIAVTTKRQTSAGRLTAYGRPPQPAWKATRPPGLQVCLPISPASPKLD
jgi:hypothetical protein